MRLRFSTLAALVLLGGASPSRAADPTPPNERPVPFDKRWLEPYFATGPLAAGAQAFRRDDYGRAVAALEGPVKRLGRKSPERGPARFMLAYAQLSQNDCDAAGPIFEELHRSYPLLASYHAYHAARCRLREEDPTGALEWADKVAEGSVPEAEAALIKLDALVALERFAEVETAAATFLERFPNGPRRSEAMFRRAEAMDRLGRNPVEVAQLYRKIWSEAPQEAWSRRAEESLRALVARLPARPQVGKAMTGPDPAELGRFTAGEWVERGMVLFERNANEASEAAFASALAASPGGAPSAELRCQAAYHRAQSVFKQRQRARAAPLFINAESACREARNTDLTVKSLYQGARCLSNAGDKATALVKYAAVEKEAPGHSYADDARLRAAEIHTDAEEPDKAKALLSTLADTYPKGDQATEALWRLALAAIQAKNWDEATRWLDENLRRVPRETIWYAEGRALYWKARVAMTEGRKTEALLLYTQAINEYPLSVYTLLSFERMRAEFPDARRKLLRQLRTGLVGPASKSAWKFTPRVAFGRPEFRRAVELARMGLGGEARRELARLGLGQLDTRDKARQAAKDDDDGGGKESQANKTDRADKDDSGTTTSEREDVNWITSLLLDRGRSWAAAHAIPRYSLTGYRRGYPQGLREAMWRLSYPKAFPETVAAVSRSNRVPEALQLAIMREESAFNPRIESFANALGLTQMLVKTARRFSERPVTRETLLDPTRNLEFGSKLLSFLLERYHRKEPLVIASYNAGEGAVDRWLGERGDLPLDEFLETIPYDETRGYTKRVLASYITYSWLYDNARPVPEMSFSLKAPPRPERIGRSGKRRAR
ncbi:MAG TPA: transglycosylase SLT domain-containing protein [Polyangia bacterium]